MHVESFESALRFGFYHFVLIVIVLVFFLTIFFLIPPLFSDKLSMLQCEASVVEIIIEIRFNPDGNNLLHLKGS